jgi:hypothetical protein
MALFNDVTATDQSYTHVFQDSHLLKNYFSAFNILQRDEAVSNKSTLEPM